eukprot:351133-Chlamydomonas_euryale.AAC.6
MAGPRPTPIAPPRTRPCEKGASSRRNAILFATAAALPATVAPDPAAVAAAPILSGPTRASLREEASGSPVAAPARTEVPRGAAASARRGDGTHPLTMPPQHSRRCCCSRGCCSRSCCC